VWLLSAAKLYLVVMSKLEGKSRTGGPSGQPPDYFTFDRVTEKYRTCVESKLEQAKTDRSIEMVRTLEDCGDIGELVRAVAVAQ
jgi:hypothetical protein